MGQARGSYGRRDAGELRARREARAVAQRQQKDVEYRRALGLAPSDPLPAVLGAVGLGRLRYRG